MKTALVLGAGGFIGSHMVKWLKSEGYWVRGVDLKYPEFSKTEADEFIIVDLTVQSTFKKSTLINWQLPFEEVKFFDEVYQFAADMGGAGYVFTGDHDADIMTNSVQVNINLCRCYAGSNAKIFYSSSACMYPQEIQNDGVKIGSYQDHGESFDEIDKISGTRGLKESDAYPANPDSEYGWEKLFSERLYLAYARNYGLDIRIARFHNIYGPDGTYKGGKEKAPAAMCRKAIESFKHIDSDGSDGGHIRREIEVWGDGKQTRSFLYIDDCIDAIRLLMESNFKEPINIGSEEMVSINELAKMAIDFSGNDIKIKNIDGPTGVRGRNSDNTLIRKVLNWEPKYSLKEGMKITFEWIKSQYETNV